MKDVLNKKYYKIENLIIDNCEESDKYKLIEIITI